MHIAPHPWVPTGDSGLELADRHPLEVYLVQAGPQFVCTMTISSKKLSFICNDMESFFKKKLITVAEHYSSRKKYISIMKLLPQ